MKFNRNKKYTVISIHALAVICASITFFFLINQISIFFAIVGTFLGAIISIIYGAAIAYILNPLANLFKNRIYPKIFKSEKSDRFMLNISVVTTYIVVVLLMGLFLSIVIPQLGLSIYTFASQFPTYLGEVEEWITVQMNDLVARGVITPDQISSLMESVNDFFSIATNAIYNAVPQIVGALTSVTMQVTNFLIGFIISVYIIMGQDKLKKQTKMLNYAIFPKKVADEIYEVTLLTDKIMGWFIRGKVLESLIVAALCFVGMSILGLPYPPLVTCIMFVFNMIPYVGPLIGSIISGFFILIINPIQALWFIIFITIVQIVDGNFIGPKLIGDSTGLSALLVIFSIMVGGAFFGMVGMLLGVPVFAVINILIKRLISRRLERKRYFINEDQLTFEGMDTVPEYSKNEEIEKSLEALDDSIKHNHDDN